MLAGAALSSALAQCPRITILNSFYRSVDNTYAGSVLSAIGSKIKGGRYNVKDLFEVLYVAQDPLVALAEVESIVKIGPAFVAVKMPPRLMVTIDVDLKEVLDLTDIGIRRRLKTTRTELEQPWKPFVLNGKVAPTQSLGAAIRRAGFEAALVPSARVPRAKNLAVFPENLNASSSYRIYSPGILLNHTVSGTR